MLVKNALKKDKKSKTLSKSPRPALLGAQGQDESKIFIFIYVLHSKIIVRFLRINAISDTIFFDEYSIFL